jgi:peptidyl-prolyl cis-trans isomerase SurA
MRRRCRFGLLLFAALSIGTPALGDSRLIDRVVAVVEGEPILASELRARAAPQERALANVRMPEWRLAPLRRKLWRDVLERLVEERLVALEARRRGIEVAEEEIDQALARIAASNALTPEQLKATVSASGWTVGDYRRELGAQLLRWKLLRPQGKQPWEKELRRWIAQLRRQAHVELRLSP